MICGLDDELLGTEGKCPGGRLVVGSYAHVSEDLFLYRVNQDFETEIYRTPTSTDKTIH